MMKTYTRPSIYGDARPAKGLKEFAGRNGLTPSQVKAIRGLHLAGHNVDHLAELYGVSTRTIVKVLRRR
jgi:hypothetical protein